MDLGIGILYQEKSIFAIRYKVRSEGFLGGPFVAIANCKVVCKFGFVMRVDDVAVGVGLSAKGCHVIRAIPLLREVVFRVPTLEMHVDVRQKQYAPAMSWLVCLALVSDWRERPVLLVIRTQQALDLSKSV
jgi:hypothetical protein